MNEKVIKEFKGKYRFLSNFYKSPVSYQKETYPTAEHLFQALKTKDEALKKQIRLASTPGEAKKIGQTIPLRKDWEEIKNKIMYSVIQLKFLQNPELKKALFNTGKDILIEGNYWHDNTWGNCFCLKCKQIEGKNQLGKILMKVRKMMMHLLCDTKGEIK